MATSGRDPRRVPAQFWQRNDVAEALTTRNIACLFRLLRRYCGASQTRIGTAVGMTQSTVSLIINHNKPVTAIAVIERIADGLDMPYEGRMRLGLVPKEIDVMRRRTALGLGLAATLSPATLANVLQDAAAEAFEFTRKRATLGVGKATLDHLTNVIIELDRAYPLATGSRTVPAGPHLPATRRRAHRRQAHPTRSPRAVRPRRLPIPQPRRPRLGPRFDADRQGVRHRQQNNSPSMSATGELFAWAADTLAPVLRWTDRPAESISAALKGLNKVPHQHPLAARLRSMVARGHARQGNHSACVETLQAAQEVCEQLPDEMPSRFSTASSEQTAYTVAADAASCLVDLGEWKDAERHARTALGVARWSPGAAAGAQLDLGLALTHLGSPDEAAERGKQALALGRTYGSVLPQARRLNAALRSRYPKEPGAVEFHERLEQFGTRGVLQ